MNSRSRIPIKISYSDFSSICRICFARNNLRNLSEIEYIVDVLHCLTNSEVTIGDGLPQNICLNCIKKLEDISDFIVLTKHNESSLREVYLTSKDLKTSTFNTNSSDSKDKLSAEISQSNENCAQSKEIISNKNYKTHNSKNESRDNYITESEGWSNIEFETKRGNHSTESSGMSKRRNERDDHIRRRREQNRKAAARSRKKKLDVLANLMQEVEHLEKENSTLRNQKDELDAEIKDLIKVLCRFKCSKKHIQIKMQKDEGT